MAVIPGRFNLYAAYKYVIALSETNFPAFQGEVCGNKIFERLKFSTFFRWMTIVFTNFLLYQTSFQYRVHLWNLYFLTVNGVESSKRHVSRGRDTKIEEDYSLFFLPFVTCVACEEFSLNNFTALTWNP